MANVLPMGHHRSRALVALLALILVAIAAPTSASAASSKVPAGWVGVVASDYSLLTSATLWPQETATMRKSGVQSVRIPFYWYAMQPSNGTPAGTTFAATDKMVEAAARSGLRVLPIVVGTPKWDAKYPSVSVGFSVPKDDKPYGDFLGLLAKRYGTKGTFWSEHPDVTKRAITTWQAWNEPNLCYYWNQTGTNACKNKPFAKGFVALLKAARTGLRKADSKGKIMLAGLPNDSWNTLAQIYKAKGRSSFDSVAIHGYTALASNVPKFLAKDRTVMKKYGDRKKPIYMTEFGFSSGGSAVKNKVPWNTSQSGQASRGAAALKALAKSRKSLGIAGVYWYSWYSPEVPGSSAWEDYTGLRTAGPGGTIVSKPALKAFSKTAKSLE
jgi:hypothetical protein